MLIPARPVRRILPSPRVVEGEGFTVRRPFPSAQLPGIDPFLMLDHFGVDTRPGETKPDHPHRGFQALTYLVEGDVHRFDVRVKLPSKLEMSEPAPLRVASAGLPVVATPDAGVRVRVIVGSALGASSPIATPAAFSILHVTVEPGRRFVHPTPARHAAFAYVISGEGRLGLERRLAAEADLVLFGEGPAIDLAAGEFGALEVLLLTGEPLSLGAYRDTTTHDCIRIVAPPV